jgi:DNA-binding PadR family transcriptional regulator
MVGREKVRIGKVTIRVYDVIFKKWPTNPLEIAKEFKDSGKEKTLSAKYLYHFRKLSKAGLIRIKKVGNTYVAWPTEIERLRIIQELLSVK